MGQWLFWIYLRVILLAVVMTIACLSAGHLALLRLFRTVLPIREQLFFSFALGLLIFGLGVFLLGIAHALVGIWFWLWPLICAAAGGPALARTLGRLRRHIRDFDRRRKAAERRCSPSAIAVSAFGTAGALLLYINILTPLNVGHDARWYHFAIAEHYAAAGGIFPFPEGFFGGAFPHFASWLYTWAFLSPGDLFFHMELAAHIEFVVFVATLAGLPILVRWILHGRRSPQAWAAVFLFPGILLYDSSLAGAADHVLALWALAVLLALRRLWPTFGRAPSALFALLAGAAALTKYQSVNELAFPALAYLGCAGTALWLSAHGKLRLSPRAVAGSFGLVTGILLLVFSPHWLKNLVFYGDPFYPFLRRVLHDHPWAPGAVAGFTRPGWTPTGPLSSSMVEALSTVVSFSFVPHDWPNFHGTVPVFGSLFTLSLPSLLLLRRTRRAWVVAGAALTGVFVWFWVFRQDRHLQSLLPWMAAVVAAVLIRLWKTGAAVRVAVATMVGLQIVWGGDVYTFPTHPNLWRAPVQAAVDLVSSGYRRDWSHRFDTGSEFEALAPALPRRSKVLIHESEKRLGTGAMVVSDARGVQGAIDYGALPSPRAIWDLLRSFGVTHLIWKPGSLLYDQRLSDEVVFLNFASRFCEGETAHEALRLARLPDHPPPSEEPQVSVSICGATFGSSVARLDTIAANIQNAVSFINPVPASPDVWLVYASCPPGRVSSLPAGYRSAGQFPPFLIATRDSH